MAVFSRTVLVCVSNRTVLLLIFLDCYSCVLGLRLSCFGHKQSEARVRHVYLLHYYQYFGKFIFRCEKPPKMICIPCITIRFHPMNLALFRGPTSIVFFEHLGSSGTGMSGGIPLLILYAVIACTVTALPVLPLRCLHRNPYSAGRFTQL